MTDKYRQRPLYVAFFFNINFSAIAKHRIEFLKDFQNDNFFVFLSKSSYILLLNLAIHFIYLKFIRYKATVFLEWLYLSL